MADNENRDDRGMETGSRERSRAETQGDGDKRSLADDKLRPASARETGSSEAGFDAAAGSGSDRSGGARSGSERSGSERMVSEGGTAGERSGSNSSRGAQELPLDEVHKINHGDKYDAMIPRGTDEQSEPSSGEGERR